MAMLISIKNILDFQKTKDNFFDDLFGILDELWFLINDI